MRRRPVLLASAAVAAFATLVGCSSSSGSSETSGSSAEAKTSVAKDAALAAKLPDEIKQAGVIRVATDPTYEPFESIKDGKVVGFDPDLAAAIGSLLGVRVQFVNTSFDGIIPSLAARKVDMAMSSIGDTKEREKVIDVVTYYWNGKLALVRKGNPKHLKSEPLCDARIGVIRGSLQQTTFLPSQKPKCAKIGKPAPTPVVFQTGTQAQLALQSGRIDGVVEDAPPLLAVAGAQPEIFETAGPFLRNPNPGGVAFPKGSKLVEPVHAALNVLMKDGTYKSLLKKWNLENISIDQAKVNDARS